MGTRQPSRPNALNDADSLPSPIDRKEIFKSVGIEKDVTDFDSLISVAQSISIELFLNQSAVCIKSQKDFMSRDRPLQSIEDYRILAICADLMRELCAYDYGVDVNQAIEFLQRQGYEVSDGNGAISD